MPAVLALMVLFWPRADRGFVWFYALGWAAMSLFTHGRLRRVRGRFTDEPGGMPPWSLVIVSGVATALLPLLVLRMAGPPDPSSSEAAPTAADGVDAPEWAIIPVDPPDRLADGRPPGEVPTAVADAGFGGPVVAARHGAVPAAAPSCAGDGVAWSDGPHFGPPVVGIASVVVYGPGQGTQNTVPGRYVAVCEYAMDGSVISDAGELDPRSWPARGCLGGGPSVLLDGYQWHACDEPVPEGAAWALHDQGKWTLATPVEGLPLVRTYYGVNAREVPPDETFGELRFVTAGGRVIDRDVQG